MVIVNDTTPGMTSASSVQYRTFLEEYLLSRLGMDVGGHHIVTLAAAAAVPSTIFFWRLDPKYFGLFGRYSGKLRVTLEIRSSVSVRLSKEFVMVGSSHFITSS